MFTKMFLGIGVLLAIALLGLAILQLGNAKQMSAKERSLELPVGELFTEDMVTALPEPVKRYFLHAIAPGTPLANSVRLNMNGSFKLGQDKPWLPMQATEILSTQGFIWKAAIGRGLFRMVGADYYVNRSGRVQFSLLGLFPLIDASNPNINRSSIGRLAGEFVWLPSALLPQQGVDWRAIDKNTIQASLKIDGEPITLTLVIDPDGKLLKFSLPRWGDRSPNGSWAYIPFGGEVQAERSFDGFTIPSQVSAGWGYGTSSYFESFRAAIEFL
ncbi:hypothetical protein H6G17_25205 [Chroococcidiopsis sp. FACHB-1243]|uniref:DUF6544 family protein n=1 Tax=Chroococcidiopsis sp. [FACHB-1243] TaxID=2692781 RepID=UPI00177FDB1B|nr:DUF6544 family protein [Chroococcidiopsis sp. [FACHB-1243]]MBD2308772.1 hypothetical protein [Chroococcidiopsis sp. [FACHB-1243]]